MDATADDHPDVVPTSVAAAVDSALDSAVPTAVESTLDRSTPPDGSQSPPRLALLKALGDNTRYAIYLELARSPVPLATADIADTLGLHPNTVRPHLERMRDVGLLELESSTRGGVGRPQHLYALAADAPSLGLEPPTFNLLARMLASVAARAGVDGDDAAEIGRESGRDAAVGRGGQGPVSALVEELAGLGFDPAVAESDDDACIAFTHCPFRELAERHPEIVCHLHRGMTEGLVEALGGEVDSFNTLTHREPCQVRIRA